MRKLLTSALALSIAAGGCARTGLERDDLDSGLSSDVASHDAVSDSASVPECDPNFDLQEFERVANTELPDEEICRLILEQQAKLLCSLENDPLREVIDDTGFETIDDREIVTSSDTFRLESGRTIQCTRYIEIDRTQGGFTDWDCQLTQDGVEIGIYVFEFDSAATPESLFETYFIDRDVYTGTYLDSRPTRYAAYNTVGTEDYDCGDNLMGHDENSARYINYVNGFVRTDTE